MTCVRNSGLKQVLIKGNVGRSSYVGTYIQLPLYLARHAGQWVIDVWFLKEKQLGYVTWP